MVSRTERTLQGEVTERPPFWFMRQAGRYLPEYRKLRADVKSFLHLCYTPELAAEVTLQPIRRFDMDAAILFSDILVIPDAMGVKVEFVQGEGPQLSPVRDSASVDALECTILEHLAPVARTVALVRKALPKEKTLIGFCGAPWTVACYMVEGKSSKNWEEVRKLALTQKTLFSRLMEKLVTASAEYLGMQIEAGADVIQIFDSWAGLLPEQEYLEWIIKPTRNLVRLVRQNYPKVPIIGFPRGSGVLYGEYAAQAEVDAVGIDTQTPLSWARRNIRKPLQGNLDPLILASDREAAVAETKRILETMRGAPFIFNLGHGIVPHTPIDNVAAVSDTIRAFAS